MKKLFRAIPHLTIVLSLMTLTFFCIDRVNRGMAFMTSELSKWVFAALAVCALSSAVSLVALRWRTDDEKAKKARDAEAELAFFDSVRAAEASEQQRDAADTDAK